jgi:uncharacterized protein with HEPN domain
MPREEALLLDMLLAARKILRFTAGLSETDFRASDLVQSAVIREIQVLGEAARLVSDETRTAHPDIAWSAISGMRNRVIHEYFNIDLNVVWQTIRDDIPALADQLAVIAPPEEEADNGPD